MAQRLVLPAFLASLFRAVRRKCGHCVIHEHVPDHCRQSLKVPGTFDTALPDHQQQIGDECDQYLYLDGDGALAIEVAQREVLLDLLEQQFDFPALAANPDDVLYFHFHVVG